MNTARPLSQDRSCPRRLPLGGFSAVPRGVPDLVSTHQVALTRQRFGLPTAGLHRFPDRIRTPSGDYAWSVLVRRPGGPPANCLAPAPAGADTLPRAQPVRGRDAHVHL